jgi:DNA-directed RNA polymerase subunit M/transcription elongation factor TFIIS
METIDLTQSDNITTSNYFEQLNICNYNSALKKDYNFMTETSQSIDNSLIHFAEKIIERGSHIMKLNKFLDNLKMAVKIELSIFEYALVHITINNLEQMFITSIYMDKFNEICMNLDDNSYLNNQTLKENILNNSLDPQIIAFLSPEQLHPAKWVEIIKKRQYRIDKEQNMATTDLYQCKKCKERKCVVTRAQIRSLDEATTTIVCCQICSNLWMF